LGVPEQTTDEKKRAIHPPALAFRDGYLDVVRSGHPATTRAPVLLMSLERLGVKFSFRSVWEPSLAFK
jgi:hypothetical protein